MPRLRRRDEEDADRRRALADDARAGPPVSSWSLRDLRDADAATRASVIGRLQQGAGNASVARSVARTPGGGVADPREAVAELEREALQDAVVSPHAGGDDSDGLRVADEVKNAGPKDGPGTVLQPGTENAAPDPTTAPTPAPTTGSPVSLWTGNAPTDNPDFAKWILAGETHGFVEFMDFKWMKKKDQDVVEVSPRLQMEAIGRGETIVLADGSRGAPVLGALQAIYAIVKARADRWLANQSKPKDKLVVGWVVRDDRASGMRGHTYGESADLAGGYDWDGANGPAQVMQTLDDLEAAFGRGSYGIGLPFQGQFFPPEEEMVRRVDAAVVAAGPGGTPQDLIEPPSLVRYSPSRRALKWDPAAKPHARYVVAGHTADAVTRLKSAALKKKIADLQSKGMKISVFPDNDKHIHITKL